MCMLYAQHILIWMNNISSAQEPHRAMATIQDSTTIFRKMSTFSVCLCGETTWEGEV